MSWVCPLSFIIMNNIATKSFTWSTLSWCSRQKGMHFDNSCQNGRSLLLFCLKGELQWIDTVKSQHLIFVPPTHCSRRQTGDLSLLYYPDVPAPLGNEILYHVYHQQRGIKPMGKQHSLCHTAWKRWSRGIPEDVMGILWARPDTASVTPGSLISFPTVWAQLNHLVEVHRACKTAGFLVKPDPSKKLT